MGDGEDLVEVPGRPAARTDRRVVTGNGSLAQAIQAFELGIDEYDCDDFEIGEPIGHGGQAQLFDIVIKADNGLSTEEGRYVLRKGDRVLGSDGDHLKELEEFREDARTIIDLEHPNIVEVVGYTLLLERAGVYPSLIMEKINGPNLSDVINENLEVSVALQYARQLGNGIQSMHRQGVIHRDLKPSNTMLDGGVVKITDFGTARRTPESSGSGTFEVGSQVYAAPEQIGGFSSEQGDSYSFGMILYALFTGKRLEQRVPRHKIIPGHSYQHVEERSLEEKIRVRTGSVEAASVMSDLIRGLIKQDPKERYSVDNALVRLDEFEKVLGGDSVSLSEDNNRREERVEVTEVVTDGARELSTTYKDVELLNIYKAFSAGPASLNDALAGIRQNELLRDVIEIASQEGLSAKELVQIFEYAPSVSRKGWVDFDDEGYMPFLIGLDQMDNGADKYFTDALHKTVSAAVEMGHNLSRESAVEMFAEGDELKARIIKDNGHHALALMMVEKGLEFKISTDDSVPGVGSLEKDCVVLDASDGKYREYFGVETGGKLWKKGYPALLGGMSGVGVMISSWIGLGIIGSMIGLSQEQINTLGELTFSFPFVGLLAGPVLGPTFVNYLKNRFSSPKILQQRLYTVYSRQRVARSVYDLFCQAITSDRFHEIPRLVEYFSVEKGLLHTGPEYFFKKVAEELEIERRSDGKPYGEESRRNSGGGLIR